MKIRYWIIIVGLFLLGLSTMTIHQVQHALNQKQDIVAVNDYFMEITHTLDSVSKESTETVVKRLEKKYHCRIYFYGTDGYDKQTHDAIRNRSILLDYEKNGQLIAKVEFPGETEKDRNVFCVIKQNLILFVVGISGLIAVLLLSLYIQYLRPFRKLQRFSEHIAKGDFDFALEMPKRNYFGAFTESFDIMREELKRAKQGEYEANVSKKELVASLSHDIKTPVATIKAICEILMLKVKDMEFLEKIKIINQKADMIDTLISNMFHATLEDLLALKITPKEELSTIIKPMFEEINHYEKIHFENELPECLIVIDALRFNQVIDNIINNSYKYANTDIYVSFRETKDMIEITIRDCGSGVDEEELPLITEKYYRGANAEGKTGSGLGLYLSRNFMERMHGSFSCENAEGFVVKLGVPKFEPGRE